MVQNKKSIVIISRDWWYIVYGGAEKFIHSISSRLYSLGYKIICLTRIHSDKEIPETPYPILYFKETLLAPLIPSIRFSIWAANKTITIRPDIVFINSYWGEIAPLLIEFINKFLSKRITIISIVHDVGFLGYQVKGYPLMHLLRKCILRKIINISKYVFVPSYTVKKDLTVYLGADEEKIYILGFEGVDGPFRREHIDNEFFDIVQIGRFSPNKGHLVTLKAFERVLKKIPSARLWLVGGRSLKHDHITYFKRIKTLAKQINSRYGEEVIKMALDTPDISYYYRLADVCVASSLGEEGYGLSVLECMSYGKPVIASDVFVETGVASRDRCLIFRRGDYEELSKLIISLYEDKKLYQKLVTEGLKYASMYSWDKVVEKIVTLIENIDP